MAEEHDDATEPAPKPEKRKKRRKKRKRKRKPASERSVDDAGKGGEAKPKTEASWGRYVWPVLLLIGVFELWMFGRRGHVEVCVAKDGVHDFALLGQKRTDDNTRRYPTCEKRFNLGVIGDYDELVEQAMVRACHRANILRGKEATLICAVKEDGWQHRLTAEHCPPWHDHYYQRMFWFLFDE